MYTERFECINREKNNVLGSEMIEFHRIFCNRSQYGALFGEASCARSIGESAFSKKPSKFVFLTLIHCSFSIYTSTTFSIQFNQFHNNINTYIHSFNANMFIRSMISMSTSSKIRTRKSSET